MLGRAHSYPKILILAVLLILLLTLGLRAHASTYNIANNPLDPTLGGRFSNVGLQNVASSFMPTTNSSAASITWFGYYENFNPSPLSFQISIYQDTLGLPGTSILSQMVTATAKDTGLSSVGPIAGKPILSFGASIPITNLLAGSTYWLGIAAVSTGNNEWLWSRSSATTGGTAFRTGSGAWTLDTSVGSAGNPSAFTVAPVPLPAALPLLLGVPWLV